MTLRHLLDVGLERLERTGEARIEELRIGEALAQDELDALSLLDASPPGALRTLMQSMNGVEVRWRWRAITGSLNIPPLRSMMLGWTTGPDRALLEGVLWQASFEAEVRSQLQKMRVFEAVAGDSLTIAFDPAHAKQAWLVTGQDVTPLVPSLTDLAHLLVGCLGAVGVREAMASAEWRRAITEPGLRDLFGGL